MSRLLTLLVVLALALGGGGMAVAQDDGPSPDSPTEDRNGDDEDEDDQDDPDQDDPDRDAPNPNAPTRDDEVEATPDQAEPEDDPADDEPLPEASEGPLDLAAMTLDSEEIPEGYQLTGEDYLSLDVVAAGLAEVVEPEEFEDLGIVGYYETTYSAVDNSGRIRSYAIEYPDADAAEDGFALLEDEERLVPGGTDLEDAPGPAGVGEEPAEITSGVYPSDFGDLATVDVSFRVDRLGVGVAVETFDGSPPDDDLALELAAAKEARVAAALSGEAIANVDPTLPERVITFPVEATFEGYQSTLDSYRVENTEADEGFLATYVRGVSFAEDPGTSIGPYVTVAVSVYENEAAVDEALAEADDFVPQYEELEEGEVPELGDGAVGFAFRSVIGGPDVDSFRLFVGVGELLVSVDAQAFASEADALDAAVALAEAAVECVEGGDCGPVGLPEGTGDDGTPVASPIPDEDDLDDLDDDDEEA